MVINEKKRAMHSQVRNHLFFKIHPRYMYFVLIAADPLPGLPTRQSIPSTLHGRVRLLPSDMCWMHTHGSVSSLLVPIEVLLLAEPNGEQAGMCSNVKRVVRIVAQQNKVMLFCD